MLYCLSAEHRQLNPSCEAICISSALTKALFLVAPFWFVLALSFYWCISLHSIMGLKTNSALDATYELTANMCFS